MGRGRGGGIRQEGGAYGTVKESLLFLGEWGLRFSLGSGVEGFGGWRDGGGGGRCIAHVRGGLENRWDEEIVNWGSMSKCCSVCRA